MDPAPCHDSDALIAIAAEHDYSVGARSLESWRYRGLLPRPERQTAGRAVWLYQPGTERQLLRLLYWRQRTRNLDEVLIALWVDGFEIDLGRVAQAMTRFVDRWETMIAKEIGNAESEGDEAGIVDALARKLARMRGPDALPRLSRMSLSEREKACGYLVATMLGMEDELRKRDGDIEHLERLLGLRRGHNGGLAPILGLRDPSGQVTRLPGPAEARSAIDAAQPLEFLFVRRVLQVLIGVLPLALSSLRSEQPVKALDIVDLARQWFSDPPPGLFPFILTVFLVGLHAKEPTLADLRQHLEDLNQTSDSAD